MLRREEVRFLYKRKDNLQYKKMRKLGLQGHTGSLDPRFPVFMFVPDLDSYTLWLLFLNAIGKNRDIFPLLLALPFLPFNMNGTIPCMDPEPYSFSFWTHLKTWACLQIAGFRRSGRWYGVRCG